MGCHILRGVINGYEAVEYFYCSTSDSILTVPQMCSGEAAPFRDWLKTDPRDFNYDALEAKYDEWRRLGRPGYSPRDAGGFDAVSVENTVEIHEAAGNGCWCFSVREARALAAELLRAADEADDYGRGVWP